MELCNDLDSSMKLGPSFLKLQADIVDRICTGYIGLLVRTNHVIVFVTKSQ